MKRKKIVSPGRAMHPLQTLRTARAPRLRVGRARRRVGRGRGVGARGGGVGRRVGGQGPALGGVGDDFACLGRERRHRDGGEEEHGEEQIGRASCRERVYRSV